MLNASSETEWHKEWKTLFPSDCREVILGDHRADVKIADWVLEFQHSWLSQEQITEREQFYRKMIWVIDAAQSEIKWFAIEEGPDFYVQFFFQKNSPWAAASAPIILHLGGNECLWIGKADFLVGIGFGVYVQRPLLIDRFRNHEFQRPKTNLYRVYS